MSKINRNSPINEIMISICIPTYNRAKYLESLLDILIKLPIQSHEIIVVDNHSTDNTCELLKKAKYERLKFFQNSENLGMVKNWNRCIELASGKYIIIVHSDDSVSPDLFKYYLKIIKTYPDAGLIFSYPQIINENNEIIGIDRRLNRGLIFKGTSFFELLIPYNLPSASGVLIKKECYQKVGNFDPNLVFLPDHDMWLRIAFNYTTIYIDKPLFSYRKHLENLYLSIPKQQYQKDKIIILKKQYHDLNSKIKKDYRLLCYIELYYRLLIVGYLKQFLPSKFSSKTLKTFLKFDLKLSIQIILGYLISFFQKMPYFENKLVRSNHYFPKWRFSIYLKSLKIYFTPLGKNLISVVVRKILRQISKIIS
jgi:glycosyltransferase involved in cell wall biosynthesis